MNSYTVTASDPAPESASATFTVTSAPFTFSVTPTSGAPGSSITIAGGGTVGFYPGCGSEPIFFGTTQIGTWSSSTGSFSVVATAPNVSPGTYAVYTQDCGNDYGFASFTVNSGTTTTTTLSSSLSDTVSFSDTTSYSLVILKSLADMVSFSDQSSQLIGQLLSKGLSDTISFSDQLSKSIGQLIQKGLSDSVTLSDQLTKSIGQVIQKGLSDSLSFVDSLSYGFPFPIVHIPKIVFVDPQGYFVVTAPGGVGQAGCDSSGKTINSIGSSATITGCGTGPETVTLTNTPSGQYTVSGSDTSITATSYDSSGTQISQTPSFQVTPSSPQYVEAGIDGTLRVTGSPVGVPEFPGSIIMIVIGILFVSVTYVRRRNRNTRMSFT